MKFKYMFETSPENLKEIINSYFIPRPLRSTNKKLLAKPRIPSKAYGKRTFAFIAPSLWKLEDLTWLVCLRKS